MIKYYQKNEIHGEILPGGAVTLCPDANLFFLKQYYVGTG